jgi:hypothetical protein
MLCTNILSPADLILNVKVHYKKIAFFSFININNPLISIM